MDVPQEQASATGRQGCPGSASKQVSPAHFLPQGPWHPPCVVAAETVRLASDRKPSPRDRRPASLPCACGLASLEGHSGGLDISTTMASITPVCSDRPRVCGCQHVGLVFTFS